jgi:hypothetical protein
LHVCESLGNHPKPGDYPMRPHTYEITFSGQAGRTLRAQFDDCKVATGPDTTILRAGLPDQAALSGLVQRIVGLGPGWPGRGAGSRQRRCWPLASAWAIRWLLVAACRRWICRNWGAVWKSRI